MIFYIKIREETHMKKVNKVIGTEKYINHRTGEVMEMNVVETDSYEKDSNFHKLFLKDFISALELVANQKTKICLWILSNLTKDNLLLFTYREIADKTGISYATVAETMKTLQDADFLRKHNSGYYIINPNIIFKGTLQRRYTALTKYNEAEHGEGVSSEELRLQKLSKRIAQLQKQEQKLQKNIEYLKSDMRQE